MEHTPAAEQSWVPAGSDFFTGDVAFNQLSEPADDEGLRVLGVRFSPGARTHWHSHPGGQVLYVTSGRGFVHDAAGNRAEVGAGDVVEAPPGELHWHGAAPDEEMVHLSLTMSGATEWRVDTRPVTDDEYPGA